MIPVHYAKVVYMIIWLNINCNDVRGNAQDLFLQSTIYQTKNTGPHGINLMHNPRNAISLYMSKALIKSQWINTNDVYIGIKTI